MRIGHRHDQRLFDQIPSGYEIPGIINELASGTAAVLSNRLSARSGPIEDAPHAVGIKFLETELISPDRGDGAKRCALALQGLTTG